MKAYLAVFLTVFLAELGDKTQLATLLFATTPGLTKPGLIAAASAALTLSVVLAVLVGGQIGRFAGPVRLFAGLGFLAIGAWLLATR